MRSERRSEKEARAEGGSRGEARACGHLLQVRVRKRVPLRNTRRSRRVREDTEASRRTVCRHSHLHNGAYWDDNSILAPCI